MEPINNVMKKSDLREDLRPLYEKGQIVDKSNWEEYLWEFEKRDSKEPNPSFWKDKKVLITGIGGFVGSNVAEKLIELDAKVTGIVKPSKLHRYPEISDIKKDINLEMCDLTDYGHVEEIICDIKPEVLFHYAAMTFVPTSIKAPNLAFQNNVGSTVNLLQAISKYGSRNIESIYTALSSEQYGYLKSSSEAPIKENQAFRPNSPYNVSKIATEFMGENFYRNYGLPVLKIRTFNQEGVGNKEKMKRARDNRFFTMVVAKEIAKYIKGESEKIVIQNPNSLRDFTHIKDTRIAHILAIECCEPNEPYNVCSKRGILTGNFVKIACELYDIPEDAIFCDTSKFRPYEKYEDAMITGFIGDNSKFCRKTGWEPELSIKNIIEDSVEYQLSSL